LAELAAALDASVRPAIVVGPAVDAEGAVPELVAFAERVNAGVWASAMSSRCSFPEDHPLFRGFLQPERRLTANALAGYDLVVVLGAPAFTYHVYRGEPDVALPPLFLVNDDEQVLARAAYRAAPVKQQSVGAAVLAERTKSAVNWRRCGVP